MQMGRFWLGTWWAAVVPHFTRLQDFSWLGCRWAGSGLEHGGRRWCRISPGCKTSAGSDADGQVLAWNMVGGGGAAFHQAARLQLERMQMGRFWLGTWWAAVVPHFTRLQDFSWNGCRW